MRLHLIISRHGLPVTRILWTTTSSTSALGEYGPHRAASTAAIASARTPNIAFSNGGYTIAQLLEDVNEVVPLETEPSVFDPEFSGQWGLEDYVVEVGGSECLHFMEVEGVLRDGDEVVIRALQLADLRARRLCGRHQITADGKHLIDGVPFGSPFLKRTTSARPAVKIPPRKKRRTVFSGWHHEPVSEIAYEDFDANADEEGDGEWLPPGDSGFGKELSILPPEHEVSDMGTVIRHPVDHLGESDSEVDASDIEEDELESELKALKEDFEEPVSQFADIQDQGQIPTGPALRSSSASKRPSSSDTQRRGSLVGTSSLSSKRSRGEDPSPRALKAVRFNKDEQSVPEPEMPQRDEQVEVSESESESEADTTSSVSASSESSEEISSPEEEEVSDSSSDSSDSSSESSSEESSSESEEEEASPPAIRRSLAATNPPGEGSIRTKKSNQRCKLRRRLSKLKELGVLPAEADFAAMRQWEEANGGWYFPEKASTMSTTVTKEMKREQEERDFQAKRQKLLRDLAAGGVDVDEASEKENVPPQSAAAEQIAPEEQIDAEKPEAEPSNRRQLDIASSRRLLFGSLGMRTPKSKEDEEAARRKLAAQASTVQNRKKPAEVRPAQEEDDESNVDWQNKLIIRATECVYDDIELSAPPFPFENRWDDDADQIIRQRKGWGKKRKRKQRIQVYNGDVDQDEYEDPNEAYEANMQLDYDDEWPEAHDEAVTEPMEKDTEAVDDLPTLPNDIGSAADLLEHDAKAGAIIAFRQLDMSKATNWQPRMSEYRVAEIHGISDGVINVRLAVRDRRQPARKGDDHDQPRQYSKFEMPGYEDDEDEDDGYRELAFAELSDPKLLRPAPGAVESDSKGNGVHNDKDKETAAAAAEEGSNVSVVEDSMPNVQPSPPPESVDMDLDETTYVTLVTAASQNGSPARASDAASVQTPGGVRLPHTRLLDPDDEQSDSPAIPSPSFSGFHSARSSPGARLSNRYHGEIEEGNLDGHTLVGESQSLLADPSALSLLSANQSASDQPSENQQHDRQVVDESLAHTTGSGENGTDSLLSIMPHQGADGHFSPRWSHARSVDGSPEAQKESTPKSTSKWLDILNVLRSGQPEQDNDQDRDERDDTNDDREDHDSLVHSDPSLGFSPRPSPPVSSLRSSRKARRSAQRSQSQASQPESILEEAPAASTRSKKPTGPSGSEPNPSQFSEIIDLTADNPTPSDSGSRGKTRDEGTVRVSRPEGDDDTHHRSPDRSTHAPAGKVQLLQEVSISPGSSHAKKKSKKRSSQKG